MNLNYNGGMTVTLGVRNLEKALCWYNDVLGFKTIYHLKDMGWAELQTSVANVNLGLSEVEKLEPNGSGATPVFGVVDIVDSKNKLLKNHVRFDGDIYQVADMVKLLTCYDLDGNTFMLYQDLKLPK